MARMLRILKKNGYGTGQRAALTSASSSCRSFAFRMRVRDVSDHQAFASLYPGKQVRHMHFRFGDFKGSRHRCRLLSSARGSRIRASPRLSASGRLVPSALRHLRSLALGSIYGNKRV